MGSAKNAEKHSGFPAAEKILTASQVDAGLDRLAAALQMHVDQGDCILLGILTGGLFPVMRLAERLHGDYRIDFCHATRYRGATTGGELQWWAEPRLDMKGATVIVIDDIYDAGTTLTAVADYCNGKGAAATFSAALFIKECERAVGTRPPDHDAGLAVPDRYVFGCGMDLHERWRHLPSVYALQDDY